MIDTSPSASQSGAFPPQPITIHQGDRCSITFDGFGLVEVTGPRRADLAGMVSALPMVLKALASVTTALRTGSAMPDLYELESALAEAGIVPGRIAASTLEDAVSEQQKESERASTGADQTLSEWINHWIDNIAVSVVKGERTRAHYVENLRWHILPYPIASVRLHDLTGLTVQEHLAMLQRRGHRKTGEGLSPRTCVHIQQALRRALKAAVAGKLIPSNPATSEHVEAISVPKHEVRVCTLDELAALLKRLKGHSKEVPFAVAIFLGLRRGEVCGIGLDDVKLDTGPATLQVRWALSYYGEMIRGDDAVLRRKSRVFLKEPKSEAGKRTLEIPAALAASIRSYIDQRRAYWTALDLPWPTMEAPDGSVHRPLFHNLEGGYVHPENLSKEFTRQCRKAGMRLRFFG